MWNYIYSLMTLRSPRQLEMSALGYPTWACQTLGISHPNGDRRTGVLISGGAGLKTRFLIPASWSVTGDNAIRCVLNLRKRLEKQQDRVEAASEKFKNWKKFEKLKRG
jgi:hypothetical protein